MCSRMITYCTLVATVLVTLTGGCQCSRARRVHGPKINPHAAADAIAMFDKDGDGRAQRQRAGQVPWAEGRAAPARRRQDGAVTAEMIDARIKAWRASVVGRGVVRCFISRNGRPLPGPRVKFVPEKFLGDGIRTATAVTDARGLALVSAPPEKGERPGVPPGFYRVEIAKLGLAVPARYRYGYHPWRGNLQRRSLHSVAIRLGVLTRSKRVRTPYLATFFIGEKDTSKETHEEAPHWH